MSKEAKSTTSRKRNKDLPLKSNEKHSEVDKAQRADYDQRSVLHSYFPFSLGFSLTLLRYFAESYLLYRTGFTVMLSRC